MKFRLVVTLRELLTWAAIACVATALVAEHYTARDFEMFTRTSVERAFQQMVMQFHGSQQ